MRKIALLIFIFTSSLFADAYSTPSRESGTIKMQTLVGEAAINNVLTAYFAGSHKISIPGHNDVSLVVNKLGVDVQGKNEIVFGYDMEIDNNAIKGAIPIQGAFLIRQTSNAYVIFMNLGDVIEEVLTDYGISSQSIKSAIKSFFSPFEETMVEIWRQTYGALLDNYFNKLEKNYDLIVTKNPQIDLLIGDEPNSIAVNLEMELESEKQTFIVKDFKLVSNKKFEIIEMVMDAFNSSYGSRKCIGGTSNENNQIDLKKLCPYFYDLQQLLTPFVGFKIRTKHGGIITIIKNIHGTELP